MTMTMKNNKLYFFSFLISFIFHFKYLMEVFFNTYMLRKNLELINCLFVIYEDFEVTIVGAICYFHLTAIGLILSKSVFVNTGTVVSFLLGWYLFYKLIRFLFHPPLSVE
jgi:hypothetical protein